MSDLFWLSEAQVERLRPFFPKSHGKPRVDDPLPGNGLFANREGAGAEWDNLHTAQRVDVEACAT